jgi:uncharacterized membrane protein YdjX (TVP38/TMEM64 family)
VVVLVVVMGIVFLNGWHRALSLGAIVEFRDRFQSTISTHYILSLLAYVVTYTSLVSLSIPGASLGTIAGGLMFGWLPGGLAALVAATTGASIVFGIARTAVGESLAARAGPQIAKLQAGFKENALSYLLFLRLVPAFPFFIVNIVPALLGVQFSTFVTATMLGILPGTMAFASIGAGLDSVIATAQAEQASCMAAKLLASCPLSIHLSTLLTTELKIALGLLSLLALMPIAVKKWRSRHVR